MYKKVNTGVIAITSDWTDKDRELWKEFEDAGIDMTVIPAEDVKDIILEHKFPVPNYLIFKNGEFQAWSPNRITVKQFKKAVS